jgi:iron-sulfur cluster insertion protein
MGASVQMITLTESAITRIKDIVIDEGNPALKLRVFVEGGGCSGMSYNFALEEEQGEDDFVTEADGVTLLVDAASMQYLRNASIDYVESIHGSNFSISNPNAQTTCGCGSSFNPYNMDYNMDLMH